MEITNTQEYSTTFHNPTVIQESIPNNIQDTLTTVTFRGLLSNPPHTPKQNNSTNRLSKTLKSMTSSSSTKSSKTSATSSTNIGKPIIRMKSYEYQTYIRIISNKKIQDVTAASIAQTLLKSIKIGDAAA
jgi:hypothetical protein